TRGLLRHATLLHLLAGAVESRRSLDEALKRVWPKPHFSRMQALQRQARGWPTAVLADALDMLLDAEIQSRTTGLPDEALVRRAALRVAQRARSLLRAPARR
ncbi:MAG TPA: hypothetical protein VJ890_05110, partial [Vineibacter sp.]|nr:hypothetical protein [Vineibacter sp.]